MNVFAIIGLVLASIVLVITMLMMLPIKVIILVGGDRGITVVFRLLFFTFSSEDKDEDKPESKLARRIKRLLGISGLENAGTIIKKKRDAGISESRSVSDTAGQMVRIVISLLERIVWVLKRCRLERLHIKAVSAGDDAAEIAMDYGTTCAVIYPLIGYLNNNMRVSRRCWDIDIGCDFNDDKSSFELEAVIAVRIKYLVVKLVQIIRENVQIQIKEAANGQQ